MGKPHVYIGVDSVTVRRDETLTVWLDSAQEPHQRNAVQIDLRVMQDGTCEVFCSNEPERVHLIDFQDWYASDLPELLDKKIKQCEELSHDLHLAKQELSAVSEQNIRLHERVKALLRQTESEEGGEDG